MPPSEGATKTPVRIAPTIPPTPWMPKTSRLSSIPMRRLSETTTQRQASPATIPIAIAPIGPTKPAAGVIPTRPAMAPETPPSSEG